MAKIILFVDALDPRDIAEIADEQPEFENTKIGKIHSGAPKVTPKVTSEVYTGRPPSEQGIGRIHSLEGPTPTRPEAPTIMEELAQAGFNVFTSWYPYAVPLQQGNGAWFTTAMGDAQNGQNPLVQMVQQPPAGGDMLEADEAESNRIAETKSQDIYARGSAVTNAIEAGDFDVAFVAFREPDEYTHFQWPEGYRLQMLKDIAFQVKNWEAFGHDVLWWSDHGSEKKELDKTFRVNKWLIENDYLHVDIDLEYIDRFESDMEAMRGPAAEQGVSVENQITPMAGHSGVQIDHERSQALSADPYDSSINIIDDSLNPQELADDLMATGYYDRVVPAEEEWGEGPYLDDCPDLVALRADNVLVTGNIHPEPIGMGFHRTGVHSKWGAWGTTDGDFRDQYGTHDVVPQDLHDIILKFVTGQSQIEQKVQAQLDEMERQMENMFSGPEDMAEEAPVPGAGD